MDAQSPLKPNPTSSLANQAKRGFAWSTAQTLCSKAISSFAQIALAWFLSPDDFGIYAIAIAIWSFASLLNQSGVRDSLIQRDKKAHLWAPYAAPLSLAIGTLGMLAAWAAGPIAAVAYNKPELIGLLLILGISAPLTALEAVPLAQRSTSLQFAYLAKLELGRSLVTTIALLGLSAAGLGAYALAWPMVIGSAFANVVLRISSTQRYHWRLHWTRAKHLWGTSSQILAATFFQSLALSGISLTLGLFASEAEVGLYFYAQNLSLQIGILLALNLSRVLLPSLSKMKGDTTRQNQALLRTCRVVLVAGGWLCLMLSINAQALFTWIIPAKWAESAVILQILALSVAFRMPGFLALITLKAQAKFSRNLWVSLIYCIAQVSIAGTAAFLYDIQTVAIAVTCNAAIFGPITTWLTLGGTTKDARSVIALYTPPTIAITASILVTQPLYPAEYTTPIWTMTKLSMAGTTTFLLCVYLTGKTHWQSIITLIPTAK